MNSTLSTPAAIADHHQPERMETPLIRVEGLTKSYAIRQRWADLLRRPFTRPERTTVVNDVSFDVYHGEFFGLLGANGAGKTTLFRMLAAQLLPDRGHAEVDGCDIVTDAEGVRMRLTPAVTDERSLNWRLSARQNLELYAALYGVPRRSTEERVDEVLQAVELDDTGTKLVGSFSSGMKQRLLIARALLARPKVLLLDEPTRSLDPISARRFRSFLRSEIVGRQQCTVLLATHNADEAFELCDRVAILERGRLVAQGKVRELMHQVSDDLYQVEIREDHIPALSSLLGIDASASIANLESSGSGWTWIQFRIPDGAEGAAATLARLSLAGIDVANFRRIDLTLADLIERIVQRGTPMSK